MAVSREEYLKRYLSGPTQEKKKSKKKASKAVTRKAGLKILDDDVDFKTLLPDNIKNSLDDDLADDNPVVIDLGLDDRPEQIKELERMRNSRRWKVVTQDKDDSQNLQQSEPEEEIGKEREDSESTSTFVRTAQRERHFMGNETSIGKRKRQDSMSSSDKSPPRQRQDSTDDSDNSPKRRRLDSAGSMDNSPPRQTQAKTASSNNSSRRIDSVGNADSYSRQKRARDPSSDNSPPRQRRNRSTHSDSSPQRKDGRDASDSDISPPRKEKFALDSYQQKPNKNRTDQRQDAANSPQVIYRKDGKRRDLQAEKKLKEEEEAKKAALAAKYKEWNKGLKQKELFKERITDALNEVEKPMARYRDDRDLDSHLRAQLHEEDPMLAFIKKKKSSAKGVEKPRYRGPQPPPNRFNIQPGYRWDGVDRSNGFEKKFFSKQSEDKAVKDMAYKWSVEDM